jgi:hypothetical protein
MTTSNDKAEPQTAPSFLAGTWFPHDYPKYTLSYDPRVTEDKTIAPDPYTIYALSEEDNRQILDPQFKTPPPFYPGRPPVYFRGHLYKFMDVMQIARVEEMGYLLNLRVPPEELERFQARLIELHPFAQQVKDYYQSKITEEAKVTPAPTPRVPKEEPPITPPTPTQDAVTPAPSPRVPTEKPSPTPLPLENQNTAPTPAESNDNQDEAIPANNSPTSANPEADTQVNTKASGNELANPAPVIQTKEVTSERSRATTVNPTLDAQVNTKTNSESTQPDTVTSTAIQTMHIPSSIEPRNLASPLAKPSNPKDTRASSPVQLKTTPTSITPRMLASPLAMPSKLTKGNNPTKGQRKKLPKRTSKTYFKKIPITVPVKYTSPNTNIPLTSGHFNNKKEDEHSTTSTCHHKWHVYNIPTACKGVLIPHSGLTPVPPLHHDSSQDYVDSQSPLWQLTHQHACTHAETDSLHCSLTFPLVHFI